MRKGNVPLFNLCELERDQTFKKTQLTFKRKKKKKLTHIREWTNLANENL